MNLRIESFGFLWCLIVMRIILLSVLLSFFATSGYSQAKVLIINIEGEVDPAMSSYVDRSVAEAVESHSIILLHINTFGGRLDVATHIRDAIINAAVPKTIAFIDKRAISAGALIALSAEKIIMAPGSTFGAATPVHETGEKASEKVVSYMRAEMSSTAELHHRNPDVARAMVDENLGLDTVNGFFLAKGNLLTLTNSSAMNVGYVDSEATTIDEALAVSGIGKNVQTESRETASDTIIRLLTLPAVSSILILIGLAGIFYTIKTGHFGWITGAAVGALILFFSAQYITQISPAIAVFVFVAGILLFLLELTPIPSFGLAAILGVTGIFLGLFLALAGDLRTLTPERLAETVGTLAISLVGLIAAMIVIFRYAPGWPWIKKFVNTTTSPSTAEHFEKRKILIGKQGLALTPLRPAGTAIIDEARVDVTSSGEFILPGTMVEVIQISASKIIVRPV